jgi:peptidoglycan/xylan/chitin deacetylase (PgdA/CDA1 family)
MSHIIHSPPQTALPTPLVAVKSRIRAAARHVALDVLSLQLHRAALEGALAWPRISLPYLHAIPRHRENAFRMLLGRLSTTHTFISYSEAMSRLRHGAIDKPYVAFSFDDGFVSNLRAAKILEEFGTTGCFFVPANFIGITEVSEAREFYGFSEGVYERAMTWDELEQLKSRGHEIENHTLNHQVLSWIPREQMVEEIGQGAEMLRSRLGDVRHFAWPRGRFVHFTEAAARAVFETGHETCASAERGAHVRVHEGPPELLCVRRDHVMAEWPVRHTMYFLATSAARADASMNSWPVGWQVAS